MSNLTGDLTKDIELGEHLHDVQLIMKALRDFHAAREMTYAMSFAQRGEIGVWMNLARKYDRIDNLARNTFETGGNHGVTLVDTLVDTAMYALKWLAIIKHIRPGDLEAWVLKVYCHDTDIDPNKALEAFGLPVLFDDDDDDAVLGMAIKASHGYVVDGVEDAQEGLVEGYASLRQIMSVEEELEQEAKLERGYEAILENLRRSAQAEERDAVEALKSVAEKFREKVAAPEYGREVVDI